jgi:uncharacterized membrane protein YidH (DUF202 family)
VSEREERAAAEQSVDPRVDLAIERTELAHERTHLAWVRVVFTLITAGLAIDAGTAAMREARILSGHYWVRGGHATGLTLTTAGTFLLCLVTFRYQRRVRALVRLKGEASPALLPATIISVLVVLLGMALTTVLAIAD